MSRYLNVFLALFFHALFSFASDSSLTLNGSGLGPLSSKTKFDQAEIQRLFPELKIKRSSSTTEGHEFPILQAYEGDKLLFTVNPSNDNKVIFSVVIANNYVKNALGPRVGSTFSEVYKKPRVAKCDSGMEEMSGKVICSAPESSKIKYIFEGSWNGPDGTVPPTESLSTWKIQQIAWRP